MLIDLPKEQGERLLSLARNALLAHFGLEDSRPSRADLELDCALGGVFATLELDGELRGCIGFLSRSDDLAGLIRRAVIAAAEDDARFAKILRHEVERLRIVITLLASPEPIESASQIEIGRHGLVVERGPCRGLLLPQVAVKREWDAERFLSETCRKAELPEDSWRDPGTTVHRFEAVHFEEGK